MCIKEGYGHWLYVIQDDFVTCMNKTHNFGIFIFLFLTLIYLTKNISGYNMFIIHEYAINTRKDPDIGYKLICYIYDKITLKFYL